MKQFYGRHHSILLVFLFLAILKGYPESKPDTLTNELRQRILNTFKHFSIGFYVDSYYNFMLDKKHDTSNLIPYSGNSPFKNEIRLNHAAIEMAYNADLVRGNLVLQWGDSPNLLASPNAQFIKNIRKAYFGFRITKGLWVDFGYMLCPTGWESSWAVMNQITTTTIDAYFEPGNILGAKLTYVFNEKLNGGILIGNQYSLAYGQNTHMAGLIFLNYSPLKNLTLSYANFFGNQALKNDAVKNNILFNNFIVTYNPISHISLVGQLDIAGQTNSQMPPDTNKVAWLFGGFLQAGYLFNEHFCLYARYEYFNDPDGFASGLYTYDGKTTGLRANGISGSFEYRPVKFGYIRIIYRFYHANPGNNVFYTGKSDKINILTISTGVRF